LVEHPWLSVAHTLKVPRSPAGIISVDVPGAPGYESEKICLSVSHSTAPGPAISTYCITPDESPEKVTNTPLAVDGEHHTDISIPPLFPGTTESRCGLSFTVSFTRLLKAPGKGF
jgi:hypothetical protein